MVEYTRDKILPEDLIQKTNLQQHNFMIDAINDIDERQGDIEDVTNVNIDDIAILKTNVVTLSNEKLDKADIDADLHFGDISVTRDGTAVIMSLDVLNPTTGIVTPISFTIPGATSAEAGTMDASSVAWIAGAEERISALEGLSDVKAVADLTGTPTQAELTAGWVAVAEKQPETGDILQDINNAKLWVFVGTDWVLYGTIVTVPLATTSTIGGVRDTSLTAPGNRWYVHVEADGRLSLIGGDALTTLIDTTIPALQSGVSNAVMKTGNSTIDGLKTFTRELRTTTGVLMLIASLETSNHMVIETTSTGEENCDAKIILRRLFSGGGTARRTNVMEFFSNGGEVYSTVAMRVSPGATDVIHKGYLDTRLTSKQDTLTFDSAPVAGSGNPVKSGGVYNALTTKANVTDVPSLTAFAWTYGSGTLITTNGTCRYNYAYCMIGGVVFMRFTVGASADDRFVVPLPVNVSSASVQCTGINDNASFWAEYGGTTASNIAINRSQITVAETSFHVLVIGQPTG